MFRINQSRSLTIGATVAAVTLALSSCAMSDSDPVEPDTSSGVTTIPEKYQRLVLVGASQGGSLYNWVVGASQIFNEELGMETTVQVGATQANALDLVGNVIQFGTTSPLDLVQVAGDPSAVESSNIRTLINAMSTPFHIIVAGDAGIDEIADLDGKSIATGVTGSIESEIALTMLECAGVEAGAIQNIGKTEGGAAFNEGGIDAWTGLGSTPTAAFLEVFESNRGAKLLPLDQETSDCLVDQYTYLKEATIPAETYPGQTEDVATLSQWFYAAVPESMPKEVVQLLAQTLIDNHDKFVVALPAAKGTTAENTAEFVGFPLHDGTRAVLDKLGLKVGE